MYKAKINSAEKVRHQATNSDFIEVIFDIVDAEGVVQVSKQIGMHVASEKKDVIAMVNGHVAEFGRELENRALDAERQKANANVKDIQDTLVGETIEPGPVVAPGGGDEGGSSDTDE